MNFWSYHRNLLDVDLERNKHYMQGLVLDIGGGQKRGTFNKPKNSQWIVLDTYKSFYPTILADAHCLPIRSDTIDCVKMTEVIHYLKDPQQAINESYRVLKSNGTLILSSPCNVGEMIDFPEQQRYSENKLREMIKDFRIFEFKKQGLFFTVLCNMVRQGIFSMKSRIRWFFYPILPFLDILVSLDNLKIVRNSKFLKSYTTGYFIVVRKMTEDEFLKLYLQYHCYYHREMPFLCHIQSFRKDHLYYCLPYIIGRER